MRVWLWSIAVLTLLVLVVGGTTRLTRSGLSIVEWRPVTGVVPPLNEARWHEAFERYRQFPEYQRLRQGMTLPEFKFIFFWEYVHRVLARLVGVVFLIPFVVFWLRGAFTPVLLRRTLLLFGMGAAQGVMGWLMVKSGLVDRPSVSHYRLAAHLILAFAIFGYAIWLARGVPAAKPRVAVTVAMPPGARRLMWRGLMLIGALLAAQIVWGAFVAGLKAGHAFNTFPLMAGGLIPPDLWSLHAGPLSLNHPAAVQWMHRVLGTLLLVVTGAVFLRVRRHVVDPLSRRLNAGLLLLIATQYALGVLTLLYAVPVGLGVAHQATAMLTFGVWVVWSQHVLRPEQRDRRE